ncbi:MAG: ABC transporter substrate-binding protein, partial [Chloroflexota bacterium]
MPKPQITKKQMEAVHSRIPDVYSSLKDGRISRREFLRTVSLLGMSASAALVAAQCGAPAGGGAPAASSDAMDDGAMGGIKRGGVLRVGLEIQAVDHPARLSWTEPADILRGSFEYLTFTDHNNITSPYMLESYVPNDDLTEWTLNLRQDITWSNGDQFNADDVIFNINEWLNPDTGSSILGFFEGFLTTNDIEKVDDFTVKLNLAAPKLDVPENLFHYPAQIMHQSFDGDALSGKNPVTGPFTITEYNVGENARVEAREGYWRNGEDGSPLPYLDAVEYIDLGTDETAYVAALASGEIDVRGLGTADSFLALRNNDNVKIGGTTTAQVRVLRFRVDQEPWGDQRLVNAVKMCQDRTKILNSAYFGEGLEGHDVHVAPVHPEFAPMDLPAYDPDGARALLDEAGVDNFA